MKEEQFVPYDIALKLKMLGFDEECFGFFDDDHELQLNTLSKLDAFSIDFDDVESNLMYVQAPLYQQVIDWLRDVHGIHIIPDFGLGWGYEFIPVGCVVDLPVGFEDGHNWNYYDARLAAIDKALTLIK